MSENEKEKNFSRADNPANKIMNSFRVNFIGKPYELNKLVNDYRYSLMDSPKKLKILGSTFLNFFSP